MLNSLALFGPIGTWEIIVILALALLIFGRRLPEVGRNLGKGLVEFKKGLSGIEEDLEKADPKQLDQSNHEQQAQKTQSKTDAPRHS